MDLFSTLGVIVVLAAIAVTIFALLKKRKKKPFHFTWKSAKGTKEIDKTIRPAILFFRLESTGQVYEVKDIPRDSGVSVGRASSSDIVVRSGDNNYLSAKHFVIGSDDDGMFINVEDQAHVSGNGIRLEAGLSAPKITKSIPVTHGLKIYIGYDAITFFLPGAGGADGVAKTASGNRIVRRV